MRLRPGFDLLEPSAPLARLRIGLGSLVLLKAWQLWTLIPSLTAPLAVRVPYSEAFVPGEAALAGLAAGLGVAGVFVAIGLFSRPAAALATCALSLVMLSDRQLYSNHLYLLILLTTLLSLSDCGAALSLDAKYRSQNREWVQAWPITLFRVQLTIVYGFAALAKLNGSYLSGEALRSFASSPLSTHGPPGFLAVLACGSVAGELFVAFGLWSVTLRRWAILVGIGLHVGMISMIEHPLLLVIFAAEMLLLYPLFFTEQVEAIDAQGSA